MFNATKFAAASIILVLTGGLLFNVLPAEPARDELISAAETATAVAEEPTAAATEAPVTADSDIPLITLPTEIPEGVEFGTIDTPAGPARWVHLRTEWDDPSIPRWTDKVVPWGEGIATWGSYFGELHTTADGLTWEQPDRPFKSGELSYLDGTYVVVDPSGRGRVWSSTDPEAGWTELDASALRAQHQDGWKKSSWRVGSGPMVVDGRVLFTITNRYEVPRGPLGISKDGTRNLRSLPDGRHVLCSPGRRSSCGPDGTWVLRLKETPRGLAVRHDKTGKRLGLIEGATADDIYDGEYGVQHRLFAIEGDVVVEADSPWPGLGPAAVSGRVMPPDGSEPLLRRWKSDGVADPSTGGLATIASETSKGSWMSVWETGDRLQAHVDDGSSGITRAAWVSSDGVDWEPMPDGAPANTRIEWVGSGWLATRYGTNPAQRWMHLGGKWVALEPMGSDAQGLWTSVGGRDGVTVFANERQGRNLWVLTHPTELD